MNTLSYRTQSANADIVKREWYVVDARQKVLGRMASQIAHVLKGKNKPYYSPHFDCGDYIIVINADEFRLTGNKMSDKEYTRYTGFPGGQRFSTPEKMVNRRPGWVLEKAVKGMLPKNRLGRAMIKKLFIYSEAEHPHTAQQPKPLEF